MDPDVELALPSVERLTGLDPARCQAALGAVARWRLEGVSDEFVRRADLDAIVAGVLLAESVAALTRQGVEPTKLMKKLRDARDRDALWPVWAEIRSAALLIGHPNFQMGLEMEAGPGAGRRPDYRLTWPDGGQSWVEFKAVGLSEAERAWHREAGRHLDALLPPVGLSTVHGPLGAEIRVNPAKRDRAWQRSRALAAGLHEEGFPAWAEVRGVAIVAHEAEAAHLKRLRGRIEDALDQLPANGEECWVALWWGNGAPVEASSALLDGLKAPANVAGLIFIGQSIAVPWSDINCFVMFIPRCAAPGEWEIDSAVDDELARRVLERFESSSGVRPTLLRSPQGEDLLRRDGGRRLFPFNLLFDSDPRVLAPPARAPSAVQDTEFEP